MRATHQPFQLYDRILEQKPDFFILLGDTVYADHPIIHAAHTLDAFRAKHRQNRADVHLQNFLARVPVYAMWDDHEVANNFNRTHPLIRLGRQAFREYWPMQGSDPSVLYRTMSWGPIVDLFLLDSRQYRSPQRDADGPGKTMLGSTQKAWFKETIRQSTATFKFVISSVPFLGWKSTDNWAGYATERDELLRFFRAEAISGVIFLSADAHIARHLTHADGVNDFTAGPLATRPRCKNRPALRRQMASLGGLITCDALNYGLVSVRPEAKPPEVEVRILDAANTVLYQTHIIATPHSSTQT
jgi:alkaline phosphatase D